MNRAPSSRPSPPVREKVVPQSRERSKGIPPFGILAVLLLTAAVDPALGREATTKAVKGLEASVVGLDITRRQYDYFQPWSKRGQTVAKAGIVIGSREILTTADSLDDRTLVRVQKQGRGSWANAEVKWIDYPANLALVTSADEKVWEGLKPIVLADKTAKDANIQIVRWRAGNLETRRAEFNRFTVNNGNMSDAAHVIMELNSEIDGVGWAEPVVSESKVIGLVFSQSGNVLHVLPSPFIRSILEAQKKGNYRGLGYFDFTWQPVENPETLDYLKLPGERRGVAVIDVPEKPGVTPALKRRDIILQVDGFDVDTQGDYRDPAYGHLMLENLSTRNKWAGDEVRLKIWRDGAAQEVSYRLPKAEDAARLVPEAPFDAEPEYLVVGGFVFQPLSKNYLRGWGQDWERRAPFRLAFFRNEEPKPERPAIVILSQVLPDIYNLGYQESRNLVVERVNGQKVSYLTDLQRALSTPVEGFHVLEFLKGDSVQRIVLDATAQPEATQRVLQRYGIEKVAVVNPRGI